MRKELQRVHGDRNSGLGGSCCTVKQAAAWRSSHRMTAYRSWTFSHRAQQLSYLR